MPYKSNPDLPKNVTNVLPVHAQDIFREAFNSAYDGYKNPDTHRDDITREDIARRVAWAAVKKKYEKGTGKRWRPAKD